MKSLSTVFAAAIFFLMTTATAIAEPKLPTLTFFKGKEVVESRPMTKPEHTAYMKFQLALGVEPGTSEEDLKNAAMALAAASLSAAASELTVSKSDDNHLSINADLTIDSLAEAVAEGGEEIGRYAERVGKAAENLEAEIKRNSGDLDFDHVTVGDGEDAITVSFD